MTRRTTAVAVFILAGVSIAAQQPPTFKLAVDYIEVDAVVTDKQGNLVRGLSQGDFQLLEDGRPQSISAFIAVDAPVTRAAAATNAAAAIAPDVVSNARPFDGRLYVMVIDDLHTQPDQTARIEAAARQFVEHNLGANDLMAVLHTFGAPDVNQSFTNDKPLLAAAIDKTTGHSLGSARLSAEEADAFDSQQAHDAGATLDILRTAADLLAHVRNRRKAILLSSEGIDYNIYNLVPDNPAIAWRRLNPGSNINPNRWADLVIRATRDAVDAAQHANVAIYGIDPRGLANNGSEQAITEQAGGSLGNEVKLAQDNLRTLSEQTGGIAVVSRNAFATAYDEIVADNSSYYVLAYYPKVARHDGKFHKIEVRVNRPGVTVRARRGYTAPKSEAKAAANVAGGDAESPEIRDALDSPISVSGLTMDVFAAPFKGTPPDDSVLLDTELRGKDLRLIAGEKVEVSYVVIDATGRTRDAENYPVTLNLDPAMRTRVQQSGVRLLNRLHLPPGAYVLRVAARDEAGGSVGSIVAALDVPDFSKAPLVLSGVVLTSALGAAMPTPRQDAQLRSVLPAPPVARRTFPENDAIVVYGEAYDNAPASPHTVELTTTVTAGDGRVLFKSLVNRDSSELHGRPGGYGFTARVPMSDLPIGAYTLTVAAQSSAGRGAPVARQIPFDVTAPVSATAIP